MGLGQMLCIFSAASLPSSLLFLLHHSLDYGMAACHMLDVPFFGETFESSRHILWTIVTYEHFRLSIPCKMSLQLHYGSFGACVVEEVNFIEVTVDVHSKEVVLASKLKQVSGHFLVGSFGVVRDDSRFFWLFITVCGAGATCFNAMPNLC